MWWFLKWDGGGDCHGDGDGGQAAGGAGDDRPLSCKSGESSAQTSLRQESCFGSKWIRSDDQKLEIKDYKMYFPCFKIETII